MGCPWPAESLRRVVAVVVLGARELVLYAIKWCKRRSYAAQKASKGAAFSQKDSNEEESAPKRSAISPAPKQSQGRFPRDSQPRGTNMNRLKKGRRFSFLFKIATGQSKQSRDTNGEQIENTLFAVWLPP